MAVEIAVRAVTAAKVPAVETETLAVEGSVVVVDQLQEVRLPPRSKTKHNSQLWGGSDWA